MSALPLRPAVFFDRDGVVNRSPGSGYVLRWEDFHLQDGIVESLRLVRERGHLAVLVTSQRGVGKGLMTRSELDRIHRNLQETLAAEDAAFHAIYAYTGEPGCPWPPKPDPGMILAAAAEHSIELTRSLLVGDADRDIEMARRAGLRSALRIRSEHPVRTEADYTLDSISKLPALLQKLL